jgi:hypothetical protein
LRFATWGYAIISRAPPDGTINVLQSRRGATMTTDVSAEGRSIISELIKAQMQLGVDLLNIYLRSFTLYVVIMGALLKFAFDNNSNDVLAAVLLLFATALSAMGLGTTILGQRIRKRMVQDASQLYSAVNAPRIDPEFLHIKYFNALVGAFMVFMLFGCAYIQIFGIPVSTVTTQSPTIH